MSATRPDLYPSLLGPAWQALDEPVRALHSTANTALRRGVFRVERGRSWLARLACWLLRLPRAGDAVPVTLELRSTAQGDRWRRTFGAQVFHTLQYARAGLLVERFVGVECAFELQVREGALHFVQGPSHVPLGPLRIPLPRALAPVVEGWARGEGDGTRMRAFVSIGLPRVGLLFGYAGLVDPYGAAPREGDVRAGATSSAA